MAPMTTEAARRAAETLARAWTTGTPIAALPADARPGTVEDAFAVQDALVQALGGVGGWKVGAATPTAEPRRAPLPASRVRAGVTSLRAAEFRRLGIEAELALRVGRDLPPRGTPYTLDEVLAAMETLHPAIEVVDSRYADRERMDEMSLLTDLQSHGALVVGAAVRDWRGLDLARRRVRLVIDGQVVVEHEGGNTAGDPLRGVLWLANHLAARGAGLAAGQVVTTGSTTGLRWVEPGATVEAAFPGIGTVTLTFTP